MFWRIGIQNAVRNRARTSATLAAVAIAAFLLSTSRLMSQGDFGWEVASARAFLGGDILIYPTAQDRTAEATDRRLRYLRAAPRLDLPADAFVGFAARQGYLAPVEAAVADGAEPAWLDAAAVARALEGVPDVASVRAYRFIPAFVRSAQGLWLASIAPAPLERADPGDPPAAWRSLLDPDARPLESQPDAAWVNRDLSLYEGYPAMGDEVELWVPAPGASAPDFSRLSPVRLQRVGSYGLPLYTVGWREGGEGGGLARFVSMTVTWARPDVLVSPGTFERLARELGYPVDGPSPFAIVRVTKPYRMAAIEQEIERRLPGLSVASVAAEVRRTRAIGPLSPVPRVPPSLGENAVILADPSQPWQRGRNVVSPSLFSVLVALSATLIIAANMLVLLLERQREIGVLKAVGARPRDVLAMVLAESLFLGLAGALIGAGLGRLIGLIMFVSGRASLADIASSTLSDIAIQAGLIGLATAAFALIPAWRAARLPASAALRGE